MIKCSCGDKECKIKINVVEEGLWFADKNGGETLMYLDANSIVFLIDELRKSLIKKTNFHVTVHVEA